MLHLFGPGAQDRDFRQKDGQRKNGMNPRRSRAFQPPAVETALSAESAGDDSGDPFSSGHDTRATDFGATSSIAPSAEGLRINQLVPAGTLWSLEGACVKQEQGSRRDRPASHRGGFLTYAGWDATRRNPIFKRLPALTDVQTFGEFRWWFERTQPNRIRPHLDHINVSI